MAAEISLTVFSVREKRPPERVWILAYINGDWYRGWKSREWFFMGAGSSYMAVNIEAWCSLPPDLAELKRGGK